MEHRDLVDIFLFAGSLTAASPARLARKLKAMAVASEDIRTRMDDLRAHAGYHIESVQAVVDGQLDPEAAANVNAAGGAKMVLEKVLAILRANVALAGPAPASAKKLRRGKRSAGPTGRTIGPPVEAAPSPLPSSRDGGVASTNWDSPGDGGVR